MPPPTGTFGDSYGNAMAGSADGAYRTELIWRRKPFRDLRDLELATFRWISWRGLRSVCTGPWATGHRNGPKPGIMQTKRRKPPPLLKAEQKSGHINCPNFIFEKR